MTSTMRQLILLVETIHLDPKDVPSQLRGRYSGRKFKAEVTTRVTIHSDAGTWSGGSRDTYSLVRLADGKELPATDTMSSPWDRSRQDQTINLEPGIVAVRHSMFQGNDMGLTFYVHPDDAAKLLPGPQEALSDVESTVLSIIGGYKSAYRDDERRRKGIGDQDWQAARQSLFQKGLIDKRGAITVAGRNARSR